MIDFEEWFLSNGIPLDTDFNVAKRAFEAGQQSKQAEVDELRKRVDVLTRKVNEMAHIFLDDLEEILKGDQS